MRTFSKFFIALFLFAFVTVATHKAYAGENGVIDFLPIWGKEMKAAGGNPPKPFFVSPIFFYMEDYMNITDVNASGTFTGVSEAVPADVRMNNVSLNSTTIGGRAGFWLFPFLQIFGLVLYTDGYTEFDASTGRVCMPGTPVCDESTPIKQQILPNGYNLKQKLPFNAMTYAVGANVAYGMKIGPIIPFMSLNGNYAMSKANLVNEMISTVVLSGRFGTSIPITRTMDTAIWIGAMYKHTATSSAVSGRYNVELTPAEFGGGTFEGQYMSVQSDYTANQNPVSPWNMVAGASFKPCSYFDIMTEVGFVGKLTVNVGVNFNF